MPFFVAFWVIFAIGLVIHVLLDRHDVRRTGPRVVELAVLWLFVFGGIYGLLGVYSHTGPMSVQTAQEIGYAPSMFQWEVGFGDLTLCVLGIGVLWFRDRWLTAAAVATFVSLGGDAIGHVMQWVDGNTSPGNVWALPSDLLQGILGLVLLVVYRRGLGRLPTLPKHGVIGATTP